jgi:NADH-quinone oxidoreductase subunit K/multicomponent Na+:H+ antiporter subunit C
METMLFLISSGSLILIGLFGVMTRRNIIKILLALNILETGINLLIVALGYFPDSEAPILTESLLAEPFIKFTDPLPQALVLTSIVIGLGTTALALTIGIRHYRESRDLSVVSLVRAVETKEVDE